MNLLQIKQKITELVKQGFKFLGVGIISTIADWAVFALMNKAILINHQVSLVTSYTIGAIINFILNKKYTFQNKSKSNFQPVVFMIIAFLMLGASMVLLELFVKMMMDAMLARMLTTIIIFFANFILHKFITFKVFGGDENE